MTFRTGFLPVALFISAFIPSLALSASSPMVLRIDATELPRRLVSADLQIPVSQSLARDGGRLALWYPKWVPGSHGPNGPIENLAGLEIQTENGTSLSWTRTPGEVYRIEVDLPSGTRTLHVKSRYIANQPSTNSSGLDSYGYEQIGMISPNTVLFYPEDLDLTQTNIQLSLSLPEQWNAATSLRTSSDDAQHLQYQSVSIEELVDSPILVGRYSKSYDLLTESTPPGTPPHTLRVISEAKKGLELDDQVLQDFRTMVSEASALFSSHPFPSFDILLGSSDTLGANGLEHSKSTFNVLGIEPLTEPDALKGWNRLLVPHEYVHAWCGKYRRPAGMVTKDFHTPKDTRLLWVYEGLTQYYGNLLEVRSGMMSLEEYRWWVLTTVRSAIHQQGRQWRSLEDTGNAAHTLRGRSASWSHLRRSQDYYAEGALVWMEIDARLRNLSSGATTLDDFARRFFAYEPGGSHPKGHDVDEIVTILSDLIADDWSSFLDERINQPRERFALGLLQELGYHLQFANEPPKRPQDVRGGGSSIDALDSLGLAVDKKGSVTRVLLDSPADRAGLGPGMTIAGVDDYVWSKTRFEDALAGTLSEPVIDLLVVSGDRYLHKALKFDQGPRHMVLVRDEDRPDRLADIAEPLIPRD